MLFGVYDHHLEGNEQLKIISLQVAPHLEGNDKLKTISLQVVSSYKQFREILIKKLVKIVQLKNSSNESC